MYIINFIRGFFMALADSVPGVSGGTIAFIMGFYDKFINSLNDLMSPSIKMQEKKEALFFLIKLGVGWITGMVLSVLFLASIFDKHIYVISSLFIGFIIFSIPIIFREEKREIIGKYKNIIFLIIGVVIVVAISYFNPVGAGESGGLSLDNLNIGLIIYIFVAGMIAISAMVLPGISGSTLLLIFGLYAPIITSVKSFITLDFSVLPILITFGLGVLTGIASTIKIIRYSLNNHRSKVVYLILGLMIGSIYPVFMGPTTLEVPQPAMDFSTFSIIFFLIGGVVILGLEKLKGLFEEK